MNALDWVVLLGSMLGIAFYGMWRTRGRRDLKTYLTGRRNTPWLVIGLSVMATQASAITFLSTPGQGYQDGLGFVQNYFGAPFALIMVAAVFLPIYRRLNVYTAYEYLGKRFDTKTRLLGAILFLLQRGIGAGITIYAPAIVMSTVFGWQLQLTILAAGTLVIVYTVAGGSEAVTLTQKYQFSVIFAGMITAFIVLLMKLPPTLHFGDALHLAGGYHKLKAVDYSFNLNQRYTFWTGLLGGVFLQLSYFGTDQSQVQRYITGSSLRESRLGLMFNAVCKIPMQFFILLLGVMVFVFYQFQPTPLFFNHTELNRVALEHPNVAPRLNAMEQEFTQLHAEKQAQVERWLDARRSGDSAAQSEAQAAAQSLNTRSESIRTDLRKTMAEADPKAKTNDADFVFITFILNYLPHGMIGLLVAAFFAAALSSKAAELNALASTTTVDVYRHVVRREADDRHYVIASKYFTVFWGVIAIAFALFANMVENLIQAGNIVASIFYGVVLGLFLVAFFFRWIGGTAVFWGAVLAQALVLVMYKQLEIAYLWYNLIGPVACIIFSAVIQVALQGGDVERKEALTTVP